MIFSSFMKDYFVKGGLQRGDKVLLLLGTIKG